jgi:hypothetical protein
MMQKKVNNSTKERVVKELGAWHKIQSTLSSNPSTGGKKKVQKKFT